MLRRWSALLLCALICATSARAVSTDDDDEDGHIRPTGVHKRHRASKAKSSAAVREEEIAPAIPVVPTQPSDPTRVPNTRAVSVLVVDARSGQVLTEKNADQPRPAASTQKLLTALIVAETGYLNRPSYGGT